MWTDGKIYGQLVTADGQKEGTSRSLYHNPEAISPVAGFALATHPVRALVTWSEWASETDSGNFYGLIAKLSMNPANLVSLLLLND